jgi:hypothetical protein
MANIQKTRLILEITKDVATKLPERYQDEVLIFYANLCEKIEKENEEVNGMIVFKED